MLQNNAATCNVIAENAQGSYEEMRVNQDQPLHLWELVFSVTNGSGRALDHLIAYYGIESPWPPCTNWTERYELTGDYSGLIVQWVSPAGRIQHTGEGTPTLPGQTHSETILLLAFNNTRPQFSDWSVNYTFLNTAPSAPVETPPAITSEPNETGPLLNGERHGLWTERDADGTVTETPYVNGEIHGTRIGRWADGMVVETPYVNGVIHGTQIYHRANGDVWELPHVNGVLHGIVIERDADGGTRETPWVNDEQHGIAIERNADGDVTDETPYVNGEIHGTAIWGLGRSIVYETPFVNGEIHGTRIARWADGTVIETPYVNDEMHGMQIERWPDGTVIETPFVNGEMHGTRIHREPDGTVIETSYINGLLPQN